MVHQPSEDAEQSSALALSVRATRPTPLAVSEALSFDYYSRFLISSSDPSGCGNDAPVRACPSSGDFTVTVTILYSTNIASADCSSHSTALELEMRALCESFSLTFECISLFVSRCHKLPCLNFNGILLIDLSCVDVTASFSTNYFRSSLQSDTYNSEP